MNAMCHINMTERAQGFSADHCSQYKMFDLKTRKSMLFMSCLSAYDVFPDWCMYENCKLHRKTYDVPVLCFRHSRAYLHALFKSDTAAMHHITIHNIAYQVWIGIFLKN